MEYKIENEIPVSSRDGKITRDRGPSSAWMHEPSDVLALLPLKTGGVFADLGCGAGDYALAASKIVGDGGRVYALDNWHHLSHILFEYAASLHLNNLLPLTADIAAPLPFENGSVDVAFIATVLYMLIPKGAGPTLFPEVHRILKPGGCLAIVESKKEEQPFGPPVQVRNSPEEVEKIVEPYGFVKDGYTDLGYTYLIRFTPR